MYHIHTSLVSSWPETIDSLSLSDAEAAKSPEGADKERKPSTIRIKIAPQTDPNKPEQSEPAKTPTSLVTLEQLVDEDSPFKLKVNDKPVNSKEKFETFIKFPETIDIIINSPESEAEIRLPSAGSSAASPKPVPLADTRSTSSDLRSLYEAYQPATSNFSTAFKPSPSPGLSKPSSRATTPQADKPASETASPTKSPSKGEPQDAEKVTSPSASDRTASPVPESASSKASSPAGPDQAAGKEKLASPSEEKPSDQKDQLAKEPSVRSGKDKPELGKPAAGKTPTAEERAPADKDATPTSQAAEESKGKCFYSKLLSALHLFEMRFEVFKK